MNAIQRLIETEEKGRGLALFGWAGVTVFAFVAAFASWQFAPPRAAPRIARASTAPSGDITGAIRPAPRSGQVPTVPTPLPGDPVVSQSDFDQLRNDLKDLRRVVGRIDATSDVLARRISNLEDGLSSGNVAALKHDDKPLQPLTPIPPTASMVPPGVAQPMPPPIASQPAAPPARAPATNPSVAPAPAAPARSPEPAPVQVRTEPVARPPQTSERQLPERQSQERQLPERPGVDRAELERMLLQHAQRGDPENGDTLSNLLPPVPDPVTTMPKQRQAYPPPRPYPGVSSMQAPAKPGVETTGSIQQRSVAPIDPTKAVPVSPLPPPPAESPQAKPTEPVKAEAAVKPAPVQTASVAPPAETAPVAKSAAEEKFGFDLGGYKSINQVRKIWSDLGMRQEKLTKALVPLARLGEAKDGIEIHLVAGPFPDKEAARRACVAIRGNAAKCDAVAYAGEPIAVKPVKEAPPKPRQPAYRQPLRLGPETVLPPKP